MPLRPPSLTFHRGSIAILISTLLLGGCAQFPHLGTQASIKPAQEWSSQQSFSAPNLAWPSDLWWQQYGDTQLNSLIEEALENAPDLAITEARLRRAMAQAETVDSATSPQLSANGNANIAKQSYNYLTPRSMLPQGNHGYARATLDFSWEIDFWGRNRAALAAATSDLTAAKAESAQARLLLTTSVVNAYAEFARLNAVQDTASAAVSVREKTVKLFRERYENGLETLGSVHQAEARLAAARAELLSANEQLMLQRHQIAALIGKGPDRGLTLTRPKVDLTKTPGLPQTLELELLGRRPDVVAARLRAESAAQRIQVAKAEFYPNINLSGFLGAQSLGLGQLLKAGSGIDSFGPAISLPIFNGHRLKAQLKGAEADYDEAVAEYNQTVTQALRSVADAYVSQRELGGQLGYSGEAVNDARSAWQIAQKRYEGGLSNYLDVLTAEDALLSNLRSLTDLQSRAFTQDVALIRALGGGYHTEQNRKES